MTTANKIAYKYIGTPPKGFPVSKWNEQRNRLQSDIKAHTKDIAYKLLERLAERYNNPDMLLTNFEDIII
jgi:uncharacterized lipoprotein YehR (DUF1307 family)